MFSSIGSIYERGQNFFSVILSQNTNPAEDLIRRLQNGEEIEGDVTIKGDPNLTRLIGGKINGNLNISDCPGLEKIRDLHVNGTLSISKCYGLQEVRCLNVTGTLSISSSHLVVFRETTVSENLEITYSTFNTLRELTVQGNFFICDTTVSDTCRELTVGQSFTLIKCPVLNLLELNVQQNLSIKDCESIKTLTQSTVGGELTISHCNSFTAVGNDVTVLTSYYIRHCDQLTTLPNQLSLQSNFYVAHCNQLSALPELTLGGYLDIAHCDCITTLPTTRVKGCIYLMDLQNLVSVDNIDSFSENIQFVKCPRLTLLTDRLTEVARHQKKMIVFTKTGIPEDRLSELQAAYPDSVLTNIPMQQLLQCRVNRIPASLN